MMVLVAEGTAVEFVLDMGSIATCNMAQALQPSELNLGLCSDQEKRAQGSQGRLWVNFHA